MADDFSLSTIAARLGGQTWGAIHDYVYGGASDALDAGYTPEDVDLHLGRPSPLPAQDSMNAAARVKMADDPSMAAALDSAQPGPVSPLEELPASRIASYAGAQPPATQMPSGDDTYQSPLDLNTNDMRGHYADAITAGRVRSPADFAERYAGAYWNASGSDPDHGLAVTRAASSLAATLPTDEDFTDAAIAIAHRTGASLTPEDIHTVKANIADHWASTGQSPMDTYKATYNDTDLAQSLTEAPQPADTTPWWAHDPEALSAAEASTAISPWLMDHFSGLVDDWSKWGETQQAIADRLRGKPIRTQALDPEALDTALSVAFATMTNPIQRVGEKLSRLLGRGVSEFTGEMRTFHSGEAPVEKWLPSAEVDPSIRYDFGGGVFGVHTYLAENNRWVAGENGLYNGPISMEVAANFKKAFVLTPDTAGGLKRIVGDVFDTGNGAKVTEALQKKGYDGLIVRGFDDALEPAKQEVMRLTEQEKWADLDFENSPLIKKMGEIGNKTGVPDEWMQDQIVAFSPETQLKTLRAAPHDAFALANVIEKMGFPKVKVVDPGAPLADAVREVPAPEAVKAPEPAPYEAESAPGIPWEEARAAEQERRFLADNEEPQSDPSIMKFLEGDKSLLLTSNEETNSLGITGRLIDETFGHRSVVDTSGREYSVYWKEGQENSADRLIELYKNPTFTPGFHREVGTLLGYPKEAIDKFVARTERSLRVKGQFAPEAKPAEKMQALARDAKPGDSFAEMAKDQDPATQELAKGYDTATGVGAFLRDLLPAVMKDEGGAITLRTPEQAAERAKYIEGRDYAREAWIKNMAGNAPREIAHFTDMLEPSYPAISKHMGTWEAELAKGPAGDPMGTPIGQMLEYVEGRSKGVVLDPNSPLKPVADTIRNVEQAVDKRLRQQAEEGIITYNGYIEDHYGHNWADPRAAHQAFGVGQLGTNRMLKERTIPTLADGIRLGLTPKIANPIENVVHDMTGKILYSHAADMIADAEATGHLRWGFAPQPGEARIEGGLGRRYRPTTMPGHDEPILQEAHAYAPEGFARNINDMLSRGLYDRPSTASVLDKLLYAKNTTTALKLASPTFHAFVEGLGSLASGVGQAIEEVGRGQFLSAFANLGKSALVAPNIVENMVVGRRAINKYVKMADDPIINYLTEAGLQFSKPLAPEAGYSMGVNSLYTSFRRGTLGRELAADFRHIGGDPELEANLYSLLRAPDRALQFGVKEATRFLISPVMSPFFDHAIPMLKTGAAYKRMQSFLAANPTASEAVAARYARQVATDVDNRLGELNFDTVFWPKATKQIASAAMISPSWAYGTYRGLAAAVGVNIDKMAFEFNPVASASLVGTVVAYGYANAVAQYFLAGKTPFGSDTPIRDFLNARTGNLSKTGAPERMMLPSELKEIYDLAKIIEHSAGQSFAIGEGMFDYAMGKANPAFQALRTFFTGKDAIGHDVANQPGGVMKFLKDNFEPIFLGAMENKRKGTGIPDAALFSGIREAATYVTDPAKYQSQMAGVRARSARDELKRAIREQSRLENPTGDIAEMKDQLKQMNQQLRAQQPQRAPSGQGNGSGSSRGTRSASSATRPRSGAPRGNSRPARAVRDRIASRGTRGVGGGSQDIGGGAQGV